MKQFQESVESFDEYAQQQCQYLFQNFKNLRIKTGLSQQELAEAAKIPLPYIIALENKQVPAGFSMKHFYAICYYFQITQPADIIRTLID